MVQKSGKKTTVWMYIQPSKLWDKLPTSTSTGEFPGFLVAINRVSVLRRVFFPESQVDHAFNKATRAPFASAGLARSVLSPYHQPVINEAGNS